MDYIYGVQHEYIFVYNLLGYQYSVVIQTLISDPTVITSGYPYFSSPLHSPTRLNSSQPLQSTQLLKSKHTTMASEEINLVAILYPKPEKAEEVIPFFLS